MEGGWPLRVGVACSGGGWAWHALVAMEGTLVESGRGMIEGRRTWKEDFGGVWARPDHLLFRCAREEREAVQCSPLGWGLEGAILVEQATTSRLVDSISKGDVYTESMILLLCRGHCSWPLQSHS